ncbi:MAG TPA: hypothetical protein VJX74_16175 [Blastocatellia bacterium]|nr:hypothetical protein [Blastocatellia bacterium]
MKRVALAFKYSHIKRSRERRTRKPGKLLNLEQGRNKRAHIADSPTVEITASRHNIDEELARMILGSELSFDDLVECFNMCIRFIKLKSLAVKNPTITTASGEEKPSKSKLVVDVMLALYDASDEAIDKCYKYMQSIRNERPK